MTKVIKMETFKRRRVSKKVLTPKNDLNIFKLEGESFARINKIIQKATVMNDQFKKKLKKNHDQLWRIVYQETGYNKNEHLVIDTEFEDFGIYFVKREEDY